MDIEERLSRPSPAVNTPLVVAVACSAGDIAAPSELASALPEGCGAAFIFVQQLSGGRETQTLAASLTRRTTLPVIHVHGGLMVEHGRLYVTPPNMTPTMTGARICVIPAASGIDCPADALFTSLAQEFGTNAIGVILSGGGSDRALGIRAIKHAGGITFAQYPGSARYPNTPISAIDTGCVDFVLRPNEIAHRLARISRHKETAARGAFEHTQITQPEPILTRSAPATASSLANDPVDRVDDVVCRGNFPLRDAGPLRNAVAPVAFHLDSHLCLPSKY
jgi:two-component system CheB/CheR fusion protein